MNRLVYLWELDSAKYTKEDILLGQNKLFDEIVGKGNQVVIAFNQLSGSPAFLCALNDKHFFECIVKLFRYGYIRLVRYETQDDDGNTIKVRTAAQYMILSIEKAMKGTYRFPKWIFCDEDKEIFPVIVEALKYNDLMLLKEVAEKEEDGNRKEHLEFLIRYLKMLVDISQEEFVYVEEKKSRNLNDYVEAVLQWGDPFEGAVEQYGETVDFLASLKFEEKGKRSVWYTEIENGQKRGAITKEQETLAKYILDVCYNYKIEDGIAGLSKYYTDDGKPLHLNNNFRGNYRQKLLEYDKKRKAGLGRRILHLSQIEKEELPNWDVATHIIKNTSNEVKTVRYTGKLYQEDYEKELSKWRMVRTWKSVLFMGTAVLYVMGIFLTGKISSVIETVLNHLIESIPTFMVGVLQVGLSTLVLAVAMELVGKVLSKLIQVPDLLESISEFFKCWRDFGVLFIRWLKGKKEVVHYE